MQKPLLSQRLYWSTLVLVPLPDYYRRFWRGGWGYTSAVSRLDQKLKPPETRYSTFGRELRTIYLTTKHYRFFLEGLSCSVLTDHRPLTFAFKPNHAAYTSREIRQLAYISELTTDIWRIKGDHNTAADALSRAVFVARATADDDLITIAKAQLQDVPLMDLCRSTTGLALHDIVIDGSHTTITCDMSTG